VLTGHRMAEFLCGGKERTMCDAKRTLYRPDLFLSLEDLHDDANGLSANTTPTSSPASATLGSQAASPTPATRGTSHSHLPPRSPSSASLVEGLHSGPPEIQPHEIKCLEKIGGGCFGEVFRCAPSSRPLLALLANPLGPLQNPGHAEASVEA